MTPESPATERLPFIIDAWGRFPSAGVRVDFEPAARPSTPQLDALIAEEWDRQVALAKGTDRMLFNGALLRYVRHAIETGPAGDRFCLTVGPTCYRDFVGTNLYTRHRIDEFGWHCFANPIGTTATLLTRDGRICYGRRSMRVVYHAGHVHTFGGSLEAGDRKADGMIVAFASVARELTEELGLSPEETSGLVCVGLIRDKEIHQPELLFEAKLELTADELRSRWQSAEAQDEHEEIVTLDDAPDEIVPFIRRCRLIAPVAIGALFIHGLQSWRREWFDKAAEQLAFTQAPLDC